MSAGIVALLTSRDSEARATAFAQLAALANREPELDAQLFADTSVRISNLRSEMKDEAQMEVALSGFGAVLAATVHTGRGDEAPWALVTFAEPAGAEAALAGVSSLAATFGSTAGRLETTEALGGTGASREAGRRHQDRVRVRVATACVGPLLEAAVQLSDPDEFKRAHIVVLELYLLRNISVLTWLFVFYWGFILTCSGAGTTLIRLRLALRYSETRATTTS